MNDIVPAVLPHSFDDLSEHLGHLRGVAPIVQIDVCDGMFVTSRTWPMEPKDKEHFARIVKGEEGLPHWEDFNFEIDLMVHNPEKHLPAWIGAGIMRAVVHLKSRHDWSAVQAAAGDVVELGLAIDLDPAWEKIHTYITRVEYLQIMGIAELGRQGEAPDERVYGVIEKVRAEFPDVTIQIDGGVTLDNARALLDAGADRLIVGSRIVNDPEPKAALKEFQNLDPMS